MILKPTEIYPDNTTFPSDESIKITWKNHGDIMVSFEVIVENNFTGSIVYQSNIISSYSPQFVIPASQFTDGIIYRYKIKVFNSINEFAESDYKVFKCSSRPIVEIITDGVIRNQICDTQATYNQAEGILLKAYRFVLYDEYKHILEQSKYFYDGELRHTFETRLKDDTEYYIECFVITQDDLVGTSGQISVRADYIPPSVHFDLKITTEIDKPYVRLLWTTVRILGETDSEPVYINNEEIDLTNDKVIFDKGFRLENNFSILLWVRNMPLSTSFFEAVGTNGRISVMYYNNKIHVFRTINEYITHIATDIDLPELTPEDGVFILIQQINKDLIVESEVVI